MIPPRFEYQAPRSVGEAVALLSQYGGDAKLLACVGDQHFRYLWYPVDWSEVNIESHLHFGQASASESPDSKRVPLAASCPEAQPGGRR